MFNNLKRNKKGFTLVELIIVIAIIGILAAVLVPTMISVVGKANASKAAQELVNLQSYLAAPLASDGGTTTLAKVAAEIKADDEIKNRLYEGDNLLGTVKFYYIAKGAKALSIKPDDAKNGNKIYVFYGAEDAITGFAGAVAFIKDQEADGTFKLNTFGSIGDIATFEADSLTIAAASA